MRYLIAPFLFLAANASAASGPRPLNRFEPPMQGGAAYALPAETRIPSLDYLDRFRAKGISFVLGGKPLRAAFQENRGGELHLIVMAEGGNVHEAQAVPEILFKKGYSEVVAGIPCDLSFFQFFRSQGAGNQLILTPKNGGPTVVLDTAGLMRAVYEAALPVDALGPGWRVIYQSEVWTAAGMQSFVFLYDSGLGVQRHLVQAEPLNWTRELIREIGHRKVGLIFDDHNQLVIRPVD